MHATVDEDQLHDRMSNMRRNIQESHPQPLWKRITKINSPLAMHRNRGRFNHRF